MISESNRVCNPTTNPNTRWTQGRFFDVGCAKGIVGLVGVSEPRPAAPLIKLGNESGAFIAGGRGWAIVKENITTIRTGDDDSIVADIDDIADPNAIEIAGSIGGAWVRSTLLNPCSHTSGSCAQNGINLRFVQLRKGLGQFCFLRSLKTINGADPRSKNQQEKKRNDEPAARLHANALWAFPFQRSV